MGTKRAYDDVESDLEGSDSSSEQASKRTKHQDKEGTLGRSKSKKRVRAIRKQLQQDDDLAADVRLELERELAVHEAAIAEHEFYKKRAAMIAKYHKARFFERKKAMRLAKRLKKRLDKATDAKEIERLRHQLHVAEVDEAYTQHFPHGEPYINLYAKSKSKSEPSEEEETSAGEAVLGTERPPIWTNIEEAMKEGPQALTKIRERRPVEEQAATEPRKAQKEEKLTVPPQSRKDAASVPPNKSDKYLPVRPPAVVQKPGQNGKAPALNRRERRRLMREAAAKSGEDKNEGESFFE